MKPINVSRGRSLDFAVDGNLVSGIIVSSEPTEHFWASVVIETEDQIPVDGLLTIPGVDGGCGAANPINRNGRVQVTLNVPYAAIDSPTIGK